MSASLGNTTTRNATSSPSSFSFDSGNGSRRILIVGFSNYDSTSGDRQVSSITYGGVSLTKVTNSVGDNSSSNGRAELWYLVAPATGSNTLTVTFGGNPTNSDYFVAVWNGIDQTNPINTSGNHTTTGGTQDRITLTTTVANCILVDVNNGDAGPMTLGAGQTSLMNLSGSTGRASYKAVGATGSYNMDMNTASNDSYAHGAIALAPATIPLAETLTDNFNDNSVDTTKWVEYEINSGSYAEASGQAQNTCAATTNGSWCGLRSKETFTLIGSSLSAELVNAATGNTYYTLTAMPTIVPTSGDFIDIGVDVGTNKLQAYKKVSGTGTVLAEVTYDSSVHKYIRMRESGGTTYWEYSTNGTSWTTLHSAANPITLTDLYLYIDDYEYNNTSTPGTHIMDNFNLMPSAPSYTPHLLGILGVGS